MEERKGFIVPTEEQETTISYSRSGTKNKTMKKGSYEYRKIKQRKMFFLHLRRMMEKYKETKDIVLIITRLYETILTAYICDVISENTYNILSRMIREL